MNSPCTAALPAGAALLALVFVSGCQTPAGGQSVVQEESSAPAEGEVRLDQPPASLGALPDVDSPAVLSLAVGYGLRTVPSGVNPDAYSPPALSEQAAERLISAFGQTGAFADVLRTGPGSSLNGRIYSLDVVLNTSVTIPPEPTSTGFVLLRLGGKDKARRSDFSLATEASMFSFGGSQGSQLVLADMHAVTGSTTSPPSRESAQLQQAWNAALDAAVPHIVRTVLETVAVEEAKLPPVVTEPQPLAAPSTAAPAAPAAPGASPPAALPPLEPLPELDDLEALPSLD